MDTLKTWYNYGFRDTPQSIGCVVDNSAGGYLDRVVSIAQDLGYLLPEGDEDIKPGDEWYNEVVDAAVDWLNEEEPYEMVWFIEDNSLYRLPLEDVETASERQEREDLKRDDFLEEYGRVDK